MRPFKILVSLLCLVGCAGDSRIYAESISAVMRSSSIDVTLDKPLNPGYRYLRVTQNGRPILMVLGSTEQDTKTGDVTDAWYSSQSEVLKVKAGRIVAMTGTPVDWIDARYRGAPSWLSLISGARSDVHDYRRERDVAARYRFGIQEKVTLQKIAKPAHLALLGVDRPHLIWFKESYEPKELADSIFAVEPSDNMAEPPRVVYSWQCLAADFCLSMQPWSLQDQTLLTGEASR